jgi:hypothetical protein
MPPPNDHCSNAQVISGASGSVQGTNVGATVSPPSPLCACIGYGGGADVWYKWTAPADGTLTVHTTDPSSGPAIGDTILALCTGPDCSSLTAFTCNDDTPGLGSTNFYSECTMSVTAGQVIYVQVDGYSGDACPGVAVDAAQGGFTLVWSFSAAPPTDSSNTTCAAAVALTGTSGDRIGDNTLANGWTAPDPLFSDPGWGFGYGGGGPLWWRYTNPYSTPVILQIAVSAAPGSSIVRMLYGIFRGTCGSLNTKDVMDTVCDSLTFEGYTTDGLAPGPFTTIDARVAPGETVYVEVDGYSGDTHQPPTLGPPNRGKFILHYEVHAGPFRDEIEEGHDAATGTDRVPPGPGFPGCFNGLWGGHSQVEPSSVEEVASLGITQTRADDMVEFAGDVWYSSIIAQPDYSPPILDNFNRPDGTLGPNWLSPWPVAFTGNGLVVISGQKAANSSDGNEDTARWNTPLAADCEIGVTIGNDFTNIGFCEQAVHLFLRFDAAGNNGYYAVWDAGGAANIFMVDGFGLHLVASGGTFAPRAGDRMRFRAVGDELQLRILRSGELNWEIVTGFDATYPGPGYAGFDLRGCSNVVGSVTIDDFTAVQDGNYPSDTAPPRLVRWDGMNATVYELPILGRWDPATVRETPPVAAILLGTDGTTLWAATIENSDPYAPPGSIAAYPVVFRYDAGTDKFVRVGTLTPRTQNTIETVGREGEFSLQDVTAHPSMPGRFYLVWSEKGNDPSDPTNYWIERQAIGCFGSSAPFAELVIGSSRTLVAGDPETVVGEGRWWSDPNSVRLVNDQGVCQMFRLKPRYYMQSGAPQLGFKPWVRCEQVEDGGTLTLKQLLTYSSPSGSGLPTTLGTNGGGNGLSIEPVCHGTSHTMTSRQTDTWVFVVLGSAFPGNHPDYPTLIADGITGVLWRPDDPNCAAGMASTRAAGLQAGIWLPSNGASPAAFATACSNAVNSFNPDIIVLDVEADGKGFNPSAGWTWNETFVPAFRALQPTVRAGVNCLPVLANPADFDFAVYLAHDIEIWPLSYGATIPGDDFDPVTVYNFTLANGVPAGMIKMTLPFDPWGADVVELRGIDVFTFSVYDAADMLAAGGGSPPPPPPVDTGGTALRTLFVDWHSTSPAGEVGLAYLIDPLLNAPARWYNDNAQANGNDVIVGGFAQSSQRTIYTDRYGQGWAFDGGIGIYFEINCSKSWLQINTPYQDGETIHTFDQRMTSGRSLAWHEPDGDYVRVVTIYSNTPDNVVTNWFLGVGHVKLLRKWQICEVGPIFIPPLTSAPLLDIHFRAAPGSAAGAGSDQTPVFHFNVRFRASPGAAAAASKTDATPILHLRGRFRAEPT